MIPTITKDTAITLPPVQGGKHWWDNGVYHYEYTSNSEPKNIRVTLDVDGTGVVYDEVINCSSVHLTWRP